MILKKVKIYNYRQLQKVELDLQNSLTVLAGPNNSGKTTLISVLKGMFRDKKLSFTYSDFGRYVRIQSTLVGGCFFYFRRWKSERLNCI